MFDSFFSEKSYAIIAWALFTSCTPVFSGCTAFGQLSPEAKDVLSAAGRIVEKTEPCIRSLLAVEQTRCDSLPSGEIADCKAKAASQYIETQSDRDRVSGYLCKNQDDVTFAGECEEPTPSDKSTPAPSE